MFRKIKMLQEPRAVNGWWVGELKMTNFASDIELLN